MSPSVHVVVSCTQAKRGETRPEHRIRSLPPGPTRNRFEEWTRVVGKNGLPRIPVHDLYVGDHWSVARSMVSTGGLFPTDVSVWVASAGYGLVSPDALLVPYQATFSTGHDDSVARDVEESRDWWDYLTRWSAPGTHPPRSLKALASSDPSASFILALSPPYMRAITRDLLEAARVVNTQEQLIAMCAGRVPDRLLARFLVPIDARLQSVLGGTLLSLNARAARWILAQDIPPPLLRSAVIAALETHMGSLPDRKKHDRKRMSDAQVKEYILKHITQNPEITKSSLLRRFRDENLACEQKRFGGLFTAVKESQHA